MMSARAIVLATQSRARRGPAQNIVSEAVLSADAASRSQPGRSSAARKARR